MADKDREPDRRRRSVRLTMLGIGLVLAAYVATMVMYLTG